MRAPIDISFERERFVYTVNSYNADLSNMRIIIVTVSSAYRRTGLTNKLRNSLPVDRGQR